MRIRLSALAVVLLLLFVARGAEAAPYTFQAGKVTVEVPKGWSKSDEGGTVTFATKDDALAVNLAVAAGTELDAAWDILVSEVKKVVIGFTATKAEGVFGTMPTGYVGHGAGMLGDMSVEGLVAVFPISGGSLTVFAIGQKGKYEKYEKALTKLLAGLAPAIVLVEDDSYGMMSADARKFAGKVVAAIAKNDSKAFLKMVSKKGLTIADDNAGIVMKATKVKGEIKKAGGVAAFVDMPASGDFGVLWDAETGTSFSLYRGPLTGEVTYVTISKQKGKWVVDGLLLRHHGE